MNDTVKNPKVEDAKLPLLLLLNSSNVSPATRWVSTSHLKAQVTSGVLTLRDADDPEQIKRYKNPFPSTETDFNEALMQMMAATPPLIEQEQPKEGGKTPGRRYHITKEGKLYLKQQMKERHIALEETAVAHLRPSTGIRGR